MLCVISNTSSPSSLHRCMYDSVFRKFESGISPTWHMFRCGRNICMRYLYCCNTAVCAYPCSDVQLSRASVRLSRHPLFHCVICTQPQPPSSPPTPSVTATEATSAYSGSSSLQQPPPQEDRMVAITDEGVTVFGVPSFALKGQAFRTKGAAALCWHTAWQVLAVARPGGLGKPNQCGSVPPEYSGRSFQHVLGTKCITIKLCMCDFQCRSSDASLA